MVLRRVVQSALGTLVVVTTITAGVPTTDMAAEVNGTPILSAEVDAKLGNSLAQLQQQIFDLRQKQLETMIDQKLLEDEASKRGVTISALVQTEITSQVTAATPEEAEKFFKENTTRLQGDLKTLETQIKNYLTAQRLQARQKEYLKSLRVASKVTIFLTPPPIFRSEVSVTGAPFRGTVDAPVTIVEFSDFHCPYCRKIQPILDDLRTKYGTKIKFVFRDFPLDSIHPHARAAAEASHCANEQGKFWEFHDRLFKNDPAAYSEAALTTMVKEMGMDATAFDACRISSKYKTQVQTAAQQGTKLGVTATPTFFINGRILVGAQTTEAFVKIIEEELAATAARTSADDR